MSDEVNRASPESCSSAQIRLEISDNVGVNATFCGPNIEVGTYNPKPYVERAATFSNTHMLHNATNDSSKAASFSIDRTHIISRDDRAWIIDRHSFEVQRRVASRSAPQQERNRNDFLKEEVQEEAIVGNLENFNFARTSRPERFSSEPNFAQNSPQPTQQPNTNPFPIPGSRISLDEKAKNHKFGLAFSTLSALGVVFGDIGTSPLYTMQTIFAGDMPVDEDHVFGAVSALFWLLNIVVTFKYVSVIMKADNHGQGGIMALTTLASKSSDELTRPWWKTLIIFVGMFGASMFFGDSMITPALSVMSAFEGASVISPSLTGKTMPMAVAVLIALFFVQRFGTGKVGLMFGPIMLIWFGTLTATGITAIVRYPGILHALDPSKAVTFLQRQSTNGNLLGTLANVILAVTGAEALYADMGHFGPRAVRMAWLCIVLPSLSLNYLGQGALLLSDPTTVSNPFYFLFPSDVMVPAVILSSLATVIASQAVITGCYSITSQAIQIGLLPRMEIRHMSATELGMIYVPVVNWILMISVVVLCIGFGTATRLSSAYGMAVALTMAIDGGLTTVVGSRHFHKQGWYWTMVPCGLLMCGFFVVDALLIAACALKFLDGAWFPIAIGCGFFFIMATWMRGMTLLLRIVRLEQPPLEPFVAWISTQEMQRTSRTAVYAATDSTTVPRAMLQNLKHYQVLHACNIFLSINFMEQPTVKREQQIHVEELAPTFWRVIVNYGFQDHPDVPEVVRRLEMRGLPIVSSAATYFYTRSAVALSPETRMLLSIDNMAGWRKLCFAFAYRNASSAVDYYCLPSESAIELASPVVL